VFLFHAVQLRCFVRLLDDVELCAARPVKLNPCATLHSQNSQALR
jgi:ribonuclease I